MRKHLVAVNVVLGALAIGALGYVGWQLARPGRVMPTVQPRPAAPTGAPVLAAPVPPEPAPGNWTVIANRNLFNPSRSESPSTAAVPGAQLANQPKPFLYGIVLRNGSPLAYIEDPATKRVSAYRIGDTIAGATLKSIERDHVILTRPEGALDVRLRDPNKPQVAAPAPGTVPGAPPVIPGVPHPGQVTPQVQPPVIPAPGQTFDPRQPLRRPIPPNLIRRLPQLPQVQPGVPPAGQPAEDQSQTQ